MKEKTLQQQICGLINGIGGRITYRKEYGLAARLRYRIVGREPVIAVEALLLGERFGVIIGRPAGYRHILNKSPYRIVRCDNMETFRAWFDDFKMRKLTQ